tara:strand:- start:127761 stop:127886 length:126 start_codon:yes stop_codon:yes gene_type:complete
MDKEFALIQAVIWGFALLVIIFLLIRRIRIRKTENFEKRDN